MAVRYDINSSSDSTSDDNGLVMRPFDTTFLLLMVL